MVEMRLELSAVIVALDESRVEARPMALTALTEDGPGLPSGPFDPNRHNTLELALRDWVRETSGADLGYAEQLYTFGDRARCLEEGPEAPHMVSIGYLALTRLPPPGETGGPHGVAWRPLADFFPWEDRRAGPHPLIKEIIAPQLERWIAPEGGGCRDESGETGRRERAAMCFGFYGAPWRDELTLERYELLYEAKLVAEAWRDRRREPPPVTRRTGAPAPLDHRRILATGMGRLRGKLKYRPVLFELMPPTFTLFALQRAAEAVSGVPLHKQNFRRMVEKSGLIESTGAVSARFGGRPAAEYRFRPSETWERLAAGVRFGGARRVAI